MAKEEHEADLYSVLGCRVNVGSALGLLGSARFGVELQEQSMLPTQCGSN